MIREWFSLDGVRCDALGIAMLGYSMAALPEQNVDSMQVPGMDGQHDRFPGTFKQRNIEIRCAMLSEDEFDLSEKMKRLKGWLSGKRKLALWDRAGISYEARLTGAPPLDNQVLWGEFWLTFACSPVGRGSEKVVPVGIPFAYLGNHPSPCIVRLSPDVSADGGITISHSGGIMQVYGEIPAGQILEIDAERRYVSLNGFNIMPRVAITSDWPTVIEGTNKILTSVQATGTVRFAERWI